MFPFKRYMLLPVLLVTFCGLSGLASLAQTPLSPPLRWIQVGISPQGYVWDLNQSSIIWDGDYRYYWMNRFVPRQLQEDGVSLVRERWITDCINKQYDVVYWEEYFSPQTLYFKDRVSQIEWQPIEPDSVPDTVAQIVCEVFPSHYSPLKEPFTYPPALKGEK